MRDLPAETINEANKEVSRVLDKAPRSKARRGSYHHVTPERKATIARYAIGKRDILLSFLQY